MTDPIFYSGVTGGFYRRDLHRDIPADAVAITPARHRRLIAAQAVGRTIVAGAAGRPVLAPLVARSSTDRRARRVLAIKREARRRILEIASLERQSNDNAAIALHALALAKSETPSNTPGFCSSLRRRVAIDAIRMASDALELEVAELDDAQLDTFDVGADEVWP